VSADTARHIAAQLERRGLAAPARLLIDAHRPLAPILSDVGAALGPLLRVFGDPRAAGMAGLLDDTGMDRLVAALDDLEGPDAKPG
jgi:hypothetical protein